MEMGGPNPSLHTLSPAVSGLACAPSLSPQDPRVSLARQPRCRRGTVRLRVKAGGHADSLLSALWLDSACRLPWRRRTIRSSNED